MLSALALFNSDSKQATYDSGNQNALFHKARNSWNPGQSRSGIRSLTKEVTWNESSEKILPGSSVQFNVLWLNSTKVFLTICPGIMQWLACWPSAQV